MILYSPAKINIGLHITARRPDGFHELQSLMQPIGLCDILEIREADAGGPGLLFSRSGRSPGASPGQNLCEKAYRLMAGEVDLPPVRLHLHKQIPVGAGLGGGSSNASTTLAGLNRLLGEPLPPGRLHEMAASLGSDCPFFLHSGPMIMEGRGELLSPSPADLRGLYLVVLFPEIGISTREAYAGVSPGNREEHLTSLLARPPGVWRSTVFNDFEPSVFDTHPRLGQMKEALYAAGAVYASLSGSGSSLYGLFRDPPLLPDGLENFLVWTGRL
jgi:4-diphosphocytidyl-2-C-methyl-D-erythritol kinase